MTLSQSGEVKVERKKSFCGVGGQNKLTGQDVRALHLRVTCVLNEQMQGVRDEICYGAEEQSSICFSHFIALKLRRSLYLFLILLLLVLIRLNDTKKQRTDVQVLPAAFLPSESLVS